MSSLSLLMFNKSDNSSILRNIRLLDEIVDEIVVIDSSPLEILNDLSTQLKGTNTKVVRALPVGYQDPLRPYGLGHVRSEFVLNLDADEEPNEHLMQRLRKFDLADLYYIGRYEESIKSFTYQARLYRKDKVRFRGTVHESPEVNGTFSRLPLECHLLHRRYRVSDGLNKYSKIEAYLRPYSRYLISKGVPIGFFRRIIGQDNSLMPESATFLFICMIFFFRIFTRKNIVDNRSRELWSLLRYSLGVNTYFRKLPEETQSLALDISKEIDESGGLIDYLHFQDSAYVDNLTGTFGWDRTGLEVLEQLLLFRHEHGVVMPHF